MVDGWLTSLCGRTKVSGSKDQNVAGCKSTACELNRVKSSKDQEEPYLKSRTYLSLRSICNASLYAQMSQPVAGGATAHARCATNLK